MKIAIFTDTFYPKIDGIVTSTIVLAKQLQQLGHQVLIIAPRPKNLLAGRLQIPGVKIIWLRSIPTGFYPDLRMGMWSPKLHQHLQSFKMEIAHIMTPMPVGLVGMTYAKLNRVPIVMTFHTYYMDPQYLKVVKINKAVQVISNFGWQSAKLFYHEANLTIAPSNFVTKDLKKWHFQEPIITLPNGVILEKQNLTIKNLNNLKKNLGLNDQKILLTVGRVSAEKNFIGLLRIFKQVLEKLPKTQLLIIGKGPALVEVKKMARQMKLQDKINFLGEIPHEQLLQKGYYALGDVFVTASMSETQGLTALEAQLYDLPVVTYDSRGLAEMVGKAGILVPEDDESAMSTAIIKILSDDKLRKNIQKEIPANLAKFDATNTTKKIISEYKKLIKAKQKPKSLAGLF